VANAKILARPEDFVSFLEQCGAKGLTPRSIIGSQVLFTASSTFSAIVEVTGISGAYHKENDTVPNFLFVFLSIKPIMAYLDDTGEGGPSGFTVFTNIEIEHDPEKECRYTASLRTDDEEDDELLGTLIWL